MESFSSLLIPTEHFFDSAKTDHLLPTEHQIKQPTEHQKPVETLNYADYTDSSEIIDDNCFIGIDEEKNFKTIKQIYDGMTSIVYKIVDKRTMKPLCKKVLKAENTTFEDVIKCNERIQNSS